MYPKYVKDWMKGRARPGQKKTVIVGRAEKTPQKNAGIPEGDVTVDGIHCPCTICGHQYMVDCEAADCECCSSLCT